MSIHDLQSAVHGNPDPMIGRTLSSWRIERALGRGGMGKVYLGVHTQLGTPAAIKVLLDRGVGTARERFDRSCRVAARLDHPHIVKLLDGGMLDGQPYVVMAFVDGQPLSDVLREGGVQAPDAARAIVRTLASALGYLHGRGIVHRDVKPSNVLVARDGHLALTDFDLLRTVEEHEDVASLTKTGTAVGTAAYMAPELLRGASIDVRCDVYSLGALYYELLTGAPPFGMGPAVELAAKVLKERAEPVESIRPEVPPADAALVAAMIASAREDRPASMDAVLSALDGRTAVAPATPPASSTERRSSGRLRARRASSGSMPRAKRRGGASARTTVSRRSSGGLAIGAVGAAAVVIVAGFLLGRRGATEAPIVAAVEDGTRGADGAASGTSPTPPIADPAPRARPEVEPELPEGKPTLAVVPEPGAAPAPEDASDHAARDALVVWRDALPTHADPASIAAAQRALEDEVAVHGDDAVTREAQTALAGLVDQVRAREERTVTILTDGVETALVRGDAAAARRLLDTAGEALPDGPLARARATLERRLAEAPAATPDDGTPTPPKPPDPAPVAAVADPGPAPTPAPTPGATPEPTPPSGAAGPAPTAADVPTELAFELDLCGGSVDFASNGRALVVGTTRSQGNVRLISLIDFETIATFQHAGPTPAVALDPRMKLLATGSDEGEVTIWDVREVRRPVLRFRQHTARINEIAWNAMGDVLATASDDGTALLYSLRKRRPIARLEGHEKRVRNVVFSPDGERVATFSAEARVRIYSAKDGAPVRAIDAEGCYGGLDWSPDGTRIAAGGYVSSVWDAATGERLLEVKGGGGGTNGLRFSPDGRMIATARNSETSIVVNAAHDGALLKTQGPATDGGSFIRWSPDGRWLAAVFWDSTLKVLRVPGTVVADERRGKTRRR